MTLLYNSLVFKFGLKALFGAYLILGPECNVILAYGSRLNILSLDLECRSLFLFQGWVITRNLGCGDWCRAEGQMHSLAP